MHEITKIDNKFSKDKSINIGLRNHLLNIILGDCINKFYLGYLIINSNLKCLETIHMLEMLRNQELDIAFSKKVNGFMAKNI